MLRVIDTGDSPAFTKFCAEIDRAFGPASEVRALKRHCRAVLQGKVSHDAIQARYGARAAQLGTPSLDYAVMAVERWYRNERKAFQVASAFGRGNRLSLGVLSELRLLLRYARRHQIDHQFFWTVKRICEAA